MDKELTIPLNQIELKILKTGNYRGISYVLEIQQKNKKVYTINSTDGYEKEEFEELAAYCNNITGHA